MVGAEQADRRRRHTDDITATLDMDGIDQFTSAIRKKVNYIHTAYNPKYVERIPCSARKGRESME
jgi:hypothetical protein